MGRNSAVFHSSGINHAAVFILPGNGVAVLGSSEGSGVGSSAVNCLNFRSPTREGVGVLCGSSLGRSCRIGVSRRCAVFPSGALNGLTVAIHEGDGVAVLGSGEGCFIGSFTGHCGNCRSPACKGVGVLCGSSLGGICMGRGFTVSYGSGIDDGIIIHCPSDGVAV